MTALNVVRDITKFRVHGNLESFTVSRINDSLKAQQDFGGLTNQVAKSPVPGYEDEVRIDDHSGRPFEIWFRQKRP